MLTRRVIDFLRFRPLFYALSFVLFVAFGTGIWYRINTRGSAFLYSVDFTGGTQVLFGFSQKISGDQVLRLAEKHGYEGAVVREFGDREVLVRVKSFESDAKGLAERMKAQFTPDLPGSEITVLQTDSIGKGIGADLRRKSVIAVVLVLLAMLAYIWYRFWSFSFGMGAVVSLLHDAIAMLTFMIWFDYEISFQTITAILFILGYSINDTIVVFSRIREHFAKKHTETPAYLANLSINETLRRTLLTAFATCLVVVALVIFGGEVLRALSAPLLVGMVFGTYSSIYIATPVMLLLYRDKK
ncbi:MAG: protein translocase subunit SecF [Candidatus Dependentiae bacterium]|nr:protein translocase subunit SecF [Candidatus Dependentiae bacterium]